VVKIRNIACIDHLVNSLGIARWPAIFLCTSGESEHRSSASFVDRPAFDASPTAALRHLCRITGAVTRYSETQLYWRADFPPPEE
jgi:hypothetical protein